MRWNVRYSEALVREGRAGALHIAAHHPWFEITVHAGTKKQRPALLSIDQQLAQHVRQEPQMLSIDLLLYSLRPTKKSQVC